MTYRELVAAKLCIDCTYPHAGRRVRCDDCARLHNAEERERDAQKPRAGTRSCSSCGEKGHYVTTCPQQERAA